MLTDRQSVTRLLHDSSSGKREAFDALMPLVYEQLRKLAAHCLAGERHQHTLRATALVHEAYMRLIEADVPWADRIHFYRVAASVMRRILVDHARAQRRHKRGGGGCRITLDETIMAMPEAGADVIALDEALERLAEQDERKSKVIELLFFGGLTYDQTAAALEISPATVHREVRMAKAWLYRELGINQAAAR